MNRFNMFLSFIKKPRKLIKVLGNKKLFNWLPDLIYIKLVYWAEIGSLPNISNPKTFNEKLQWLKLHDRKPEYCMYADKFEVRSYIKKMIGEQYLIPLIGIYDNVSEINWQTLPDKFVLKCTHGSHCHIICTEKKKLDIRDAEIKLTKWLKRSWYWLGREWPYKNMKGRIICEKYLGDLAGAPNDYKIMCFNGEPRIIQIHRKDISGSHTIDFYDIKGQILPVRKKGFKNSDVSNINVDNLKEMISLSQKLSAGTLYLRTDFYLVNNKVYFGELTMFDSSGLIDFEPVESSVFLGDLLNLG